MRRKVFAAMALATMTILALPAGADAQIPPPERARVARPGTDPAARILELRQELGLTDAQVTQIGRIQAQLQEQNAPLREQLSGAREQLRAQRQEITPEERTQMRERREAMRDSMRARAEQLTPQQRDSMRTRMRGRMGAVRQRPGFAGRARTIVPEELRPVLDQLRTNTQNAIQQIRSTLTAEQQEKLGELRSTARREGRPGLRQSPRGARSRVQGPAGRTR